MPTVDESHYKEVVGRFATGVAVVTGVTPEGPAGFTCQTFGSLSLEPIIISFAAALTSQSWPRVRVRGVLGVNVLAEDQEALARVFAVSGAEKFRDVSWSDGPQGSPLLDRALAHLEGHVLSTARHGDHEFVTVAVDHVAAHAGKPLLYYRGGFGLLA